MKRHFSSWGARAKPWLIAWTSLPSVPLPTTHYEFATWQFSRVNIDYHIAVQGTYYSVPYALVGEQLDTRITQHLVEAFHRGKRVARHPRTRHKGTYSTEPAHRPKAHQKHLEWTPSRLVHWGNSIGPNTGILVERILERRNHLEQGYRACQGLLNLSKQ